MILPEDLPPRLRTREIHGALPARGEEETESLEERETSRHASAEPAPRREAVETRHRSSRLETLDLQELERRAIQQALEEAGGNLSQVVRLLGIGRTTLYRKLKSHRLRE